MKPLLFTLALVAIVATAQTNTNKLIMPPSSAHVTPVVIPPGVHLQGANIVLDELEIPEDIGTNWFIQFKGENTNYWQNIYLTGTDLYQLAIYGVSNKYVITKFGTNIFTNLASTVDYPLPKPLPMRIVEASLRTNKDGSVVLTGWKP